MTSEPRSGSGESARPQAVRELARPDSADRMPRLLQALKDDSWRVRREAVDALLAQTGCESTGAMLRVMRNHVTDLGLFNSAIQVVSQIGGGHLRAARGASGRQRPGVANLRPPSPWGIKTIAGRCLHSCELWAIPTRTSAITRSRPSENWKSCEAVDSLMKLVESRDFALAFPALDALSSIGDARAAGPLTALLDDPTLRQPAIEAIGWLGGKAAVGPLIDVLHGHRALATAVAMALIRMRERYETRYGRGDLIESAIRLTIAEEDAKLMVDAAASVDGPELEAIAHLLGGLEGVAVDQTLAQLLLRPASRSAAAEALVRRGSRVVNVLVERSDDDDLEIRRTAIVTLGRIGDAKAIPALLRTLKNDPESIVAAAGALAMIGDRESYPTLLEFLGDENAPVRRAVVSALNSLGHPQMAVDMERLLGDPDPRVRESAVSVVGYAGFPTCAQAMLGCCRDENEQVRKTALEALPAFEDSRVLPMLAEGLADSVPAVRAAAARALGQIDRNDVWPLLEKAIADKSSWVRYYAVRSVARPALAASLETLHRLAERDPAMQVRVAAVEALGQFGEASSIPLLRALAQSPDTDLVRTAIAALGATRQVDAMPPLTIALESPGCAKRRIDAAARYSWIDRSRGSCGRPSSCRAVGDRWGRGEDGR